MMQTFVEWWRQIAPLITGAWHETTGMLAQWWRETESLVAAGDMTQIAVRATPLVLGY